MKGCGCAVVVAAPEAVGRGWGRGGVVVEVVVGGLFAAGFSTVEKNVCGFGLGVGGGGMLVGS